MVDLHRTPKPEPEAVNVDDVIAESFVSLAGSVKKIVWVAEVVVPRALNDLALKLGRIADAVEGMERREARLEEALTSVEQSNRRLAAAMERLNNAE